MISLSLSLTHTHICVKYLPTTVSAISNGREPKSCLGRVFNSMLGLIATLCSKCMVSMQPLLKLKTRPRVCPVSYVCPCLLPYSMHHSQGPGNTN